jgi:ABC-type lipoprotein export system ATPase subunit
LFEELVANDKTILMVTHDLDLAQRATQTVMLADGHIVNNGPTPAGVRSSSSQFPSPAPTVEHL